MNKNRIFLIAMSAVCLLLFMFRMTGLTAHIAISVAGLAVMIPLTVATRKEWKKPSLEIVMRAMYFIAIVTGGALMKMHGVHALALIHKVSSLLFAVLLLALYVPKCKK